MDEMKICPFCGKEILAVAKMCKYCREWLPDESTKTVKPIETKLANTEECSQENPTEDKIGQATVLNSNETGSMFKTMLKHSEEREAAIEAALAEMDEPDPTISKRERLKKIDDLYEEIYKLECSKVSGPEEVAKIRKRVQELELELRKEEKAAGVPHALWDRPKSYYRKRRIIIISVVVVIIAAIIWVMR